MFLEHIFVHMQVMYDCAGSYVQTKVDKSVLW